MEIRIQRIFLRALIGLTLMASASNSFAAQNETSNQSEESAADNVSIFNPKVERRKVERDAIDSENWEVGIDYGIISIEDFGSNEITSVNLNYHVTEDFFLGFNYGQTTGGETSFEKLTGDAVLLTDKQREYSHYSIGLGFNVLPGEGFIGEDLAFSSVFYLLTGLGSTEFAGDDRSTIMLGGGYKVLFNDWFSVHFQLKDHIYDIELLGVKNTANDLEVSAGFTVFF